MDYLQTILLGIIQGLTEFFPVSSSGFLILTENVLRIQGSTEFLNVILHAGTLIAIFLAMQKDIARLAGEAFRMLRDILSNIRIMFKSIRSHREPRYIHIVTSNYRQLVILVLCASLTTALTALLLGRAAYLASGSVLYSGLGMLVTGILLLVTDMVPSGSKVPMEISFKAALLIGLVQGLSVIPGISRTGIVLVCGLLLGFNRRLAIRFSYLLSIPSIIGALVLQLTKLHMLDISIRYAGAVTVGAVFAALTGMLTIQSVSRYIRLNRMKTFAIWNFAAGGIIIVLSFII